MTRSGLSNKIVVTAIIICLYLIPSTAVVAGCLIALQKETQTRTSKEYDGELQVFVDDQAFLFDLDQGDSKVSTRTRV